MVVSLMFVRPVVLEELKRKHSRSKLNTEKTLLYNIDDSYNASPMLGLLHRRKLISSIGGFELFQITTPF